MRGGSGLVQSDFAASDSKEANAIREPCSTRGFDVVNGRWMVLWTKSRQEKAVARYLDP